MLQWCHASAQSDLGSRWRWPQGVAQRHDWCSYSPSDVGVTEEEDEEGPPARKGGPTASKEMLLCCRMAEMLSRIYDGKAGTGFRGFRETSTMMDK